MFIRRYFIGAKKNIAIRMNKDTALIILKANYSRCRKVRIIALMYRLPVKLYIIIIHTTNLQSHWLIVFKNKCVVLFYCCWYYYFTCICAKNVCMNTSFYFIILTPSLSINTMIWTTFIQNVYKHLKAVSNDLNRIYVFCIFYSQYSINYMV